MRLLYINKIETNAGWGLETFINQSLNQQGVETICIDYEKYKYCLAQKLLQLEEDFDALLLQRGTGYLIPRQIIKTINRPRFFLFTELIARNPKQNYLFQSNLFNHIFLRSQPCIDLVTEQGWLKLNEVSLVLSAINPSFHKPLQGVTKDIDILFVGTLLPRRKRILEELSKHFAVVTRQVFGPEMVELINRAKIILNIHGEEFLDTETRVYEVLACQGFLLTENLSSESPFYNGKHLVEVETVEELKNIITYYLSHPKQRVQIAESGYKEVIIKHTFSKRAEEIKKIIQTHIVNYQSIGKPLDYQKLQYLNSWEKIIKTKDEFTTSTRIKLSKVKQQTISFSKQFS